MVNEVKKEVSGNIEGLESKTKKFGVKLISFAVTCWLIVGTVVVSFVVPGYIVQTLVKVQWQDEAEASVTPVTKPVQVIQLKDRYSLRADRYEAPSFLRKGLRDTTDTVSEFRRLVRGIASFQGR